MNRRVIGISLLFMLVLCITSCAEKASSSAEIKTDERSSIKQSQDEMNYGKPLSDDEFVINSIGLDSTKEEVEKAFGKPQSVVTGGGYFIYYYTDEKTVGIPDSYYFKASFMEDQDANKPQIFELSLNYDEQSKDLYCTRGIKIDDDLGEAVKRLYLTDELKQMGIDHLDSEVSIDEKINIFKEGNNRVSFESKSALMQLDYFEDMKIERIEITKYFYPQATSPTSIAEDTSYDKNEPLSDDEALFNNLKYAWWSREEILNSLGSPIKSTLEFSDYDLYAFGFVIETLYYDKTEVVISGIEDINKKNDGLVESFTTTDENVIGPRGIKVGDNINNVLDRFPHYEIDFSLTNQSAPFYGETDESLQEEKFASIEYGKTKGEGEILLHPQYFNAVWIKYSNYTITEIDYGTRPD